VTATRVALVGAAVVLAVVGQVAVLPWLPFPGGPPDLVLAVVLAVALTAGPQAGALGGFGAGLALDLAPPADHAVGQWAFVLCLVGYLAGLVAREARQSTSVMLAAAALAGLLSPGVFLLVGSLLDDPRVDWAAAAGGLPGHVGYVVLLTPLFAAVAQRRSAEPAP
jgi:rod shape-determining protein MreD